MSTSAKFTCVPFAILLLSSVIVPIGIVFAVTTFVDSFDVSGQETNPRAIAFNTDGTKMFVIGYTNDIVYEYTCTTGFDVSTCADAGSPSIAITALEGTPDGLAFNTDGTKMFVVGGTNDLVHEFTCTTGFDVSTCADAASPSPNISDTDTTATGVAFNTDGTKMYIVGVNNRVGEYDCTTGFDVSTCSADFDRSLDISAQDPNPHDIAFNTDGTKMFIVGENADNIEVYGCTTGFDVSTCTYSGNDKRFSVLNEENSPSGIAFSSNGLKMFVLGITGQDVNEYILEVAFDFISSAPATISTDGAARQGDFFPPTLGVDQNGKRVVDYGFSYNGQRIQVERFFTPFPLLPVKVGEQNIAELVIYENLQERDLTHVALALGLRTGQNFADSHVIIVWDRVWGGENGGVETVSQIDPHNIIDDDSLLVQSSKVQCLEKVQSDHLCTKLEIFHTFRGTLEWDNIKTNVWDHKRNAWQNTFNHGIHVEGESLNPPVKHTVLDKRDLITITEIGNNVALDNEGYLWEYDKSWQKKFVPKEKIDDGVTMHLFDRNHASFETYKKGQELVAKSVLESICPNCMDKPFEEINSIKLSPYTNLKDSPRIDDNLQKTMESEIIRAEKMYPHIYNVSDRNIDQSDTMHYIVRL